MRRCSAWRSICLRSANTAASIAIGSTARMSSRTTAASQELPVRWLRRWSPPHRRALLPDRDRQAQRPQPVPLSRRRARPHRRSPGTANRRTAPLALDARRTEARRRLTRRLHRALTIERPLRRAQVAPHRIDTTALPRASHSRQRNRLSRSTIFPLGFTPAVASIVGVSTTACPQAHSSWTRSPGPRSSSRAA